MIKYHGTPVTPRDIFFKALTNKNTLVSWANPQDVNFAFANCNKVCLDNGAFTFWKKKKDVNWNDYYKWVDKFNNREFFIIPDIIDGTEGENDFLISQYFSKYKKNNGVPVWHVAESFERLKYLKDCFDYIAIGSSGEYSELGTEKWHKRMNEAMSIVCNEDGKPNVKIHMLRCLNPKIFTKYPFYSGDSTNLARNHARDGWQKILERIEKYNSPEYYKFKTYYETKSLF